VAGRKVGELRMCPLCLRAMKFDDSPTQGWVCEDCGYRCDVDEEEYLFIKAKK